MTSETVDNGQAVHAVYLNAERKARQGYSVDTGGTVTINSGTLDDPDTLTVAAADYWFGGQPVSSVQTDVRIDSGAGDPRKDIIYLDGAGNVQVAKGSPAPVPSDQQGTVRFATYRPTPPDLADTDAVLLAEVWVATGANQLVADDVADRRKFENQRTVLKSKDVTLSGGSQPALDTVVDAVADDQFQDLTVYLTPDADPAFAADYGIAAPQWTRFWDDTNQQIDVEVSASWDPDPGAGNDVSATVYVVHEDL